MLRPPSGLGITDAAHQFHTLLCYNKGQAVLEWKQKSDHEVGQAENASSMQACTIVSGANLNRAKIYLQIDANLGSHHPMP